MHHKNKMKIIILIFLISFSIFHFSLAQTPSTNTSNTNNYNTLKGLKTVAETNAGYGHVDEDSPRTIAANIIKVILSFTGIIFLILIIVSGYQWMTAGGNEETIAKAKKRIINATIGVAIVILSYSIFSFFFVELWNILSNS